MLQKHLELSGWQALQSKSDADTDVVAVALHLASTQPLPVAVAASDTDILVLLLFHYKGTSDTADIYFMSQAHKRIQTETKPINIRQVQKHIGQEICQRLLVIHAVGGCDTTSAICRLGKGTILNRLGKCSELASAMETMMNDQATVDEVIAAGTQIMVKIYGGQSGDKLDKMRYTAYCKMISVSLLRPQPQRLPPTERAAAFHCMRVHLQVARWKELEANYMDALEWGWQLKDGRLIPIMTDLPAAPSDVLDLVRCNCKGDCTSTLCSCRKNALKCTSACGHCNGDCANASELQKEPEHTDDSSDTDDEILEADESEEVMMYGDSDVDWEFEEVV